jgi:molecular chaperone GrpE
MSNNKESRKENENVEEIKENDSNVSETTDNVRAKKDEPTTEELLSQEKDRFLRLFAEFENYKKRTAKERLELFRTANRELMTVLLPILDDFDRGLTEIKKVKDKELLKGMQLIQNKLKSSLEQKGLSHVKVKQGDNFDADIHQAITQIPAPSKKLKGKIIDVTEQGYMLGDVIIRFPKVVVGK